MIDERVTAVLDESVPTFDEEAANWDDVVRRVRRQRRRRATVGIGVFAGLVLLAVPPAGLGERLVDWFRGAPATPEVRRAIESTNVPPPVFELLRKQPEVDASKARGVLALQTSRGQVRLWSAPRDDGGACAFIEVGVRDGRAVGSTACHPPLRPREVVISADLRPIDLELQENRLVFAMVFGWKPGIEVVITWSDRSRSRLPVTDGYALTEVKEKAEPVEAYAVRGEAILSAQAFPWSRPTASPRQELPYRVVARDTTFDGRRVTLKVRTAYGQLCERIEIVGPSGRSGSGGCQRAGRVTRGTSSIAFRLDLRAAIFSGRVTVRAKTLRILFEDGARTTVPVTEGFFLYAVQPPHLKAGHLPARLQALAADGSILAAAEVPR